jgi:hypothetical protein
MSWPQNSARCKKCSKDVYIGTIPSLSRRPPIPASFRALRVFFLYSCRRPGSAANESALSGFGRLEFRTASARPPNRTATSGSNGDRARQRERFHNSGALFGVVQGDSFPGRRHLTFVPSGFSNGGTTATSGSLDGPQERRKAKHIWLMKSTTPPELIPEHCWR